MHTIGIDFGTNSGRAIVVSCADGRTVGTGVSDYHSGDQGVLTASVAIRTWRGRIRPTTSARWAMPVDRGARATPRRRRAFRAIA